MVAQIIFWGGLAFLTVTAIALGGAEESNHRRAHRDRLAEKRARHNRTRRLSAGKKECTNCSCC